MIEHGILLSHAHDNHVITCPDHDTALRVAQDTRATQPDRNRLTLTIDCEGPS